MNKYIPSTSKRVRDQVELYEKSNGTEGNTVSHFPVMIVTNLGRKSGAIRKTPLITVKDGDRYVLIASQGGSPKHPNWYYNLRANPTVKIQDGSTIYDMKILYGAPVCSVKQAVHNSAYNRRLSLSIFSKYARYTR